jgi:hypothetical protein
VHTELFGNVLLDAYGAPVVVDVVPAWLPTRVAEGLCVLDAVGAGAAPESVLARWDVDAAREYRRVSPR